MARPPKFEVALINRESLRLAQAVATFEGRAKYAVADALRATAQAAARDVRLDLKQRFQLKRKDLRRVRAYRRRGVHFSQPYYTAFFGYKTKINRRRAQLTADERTSLTGADGWFEVDRTPASTVRPEFFLFMYRRKGRSRLPLEKYQLDLAPLAEPMLSAAARRHWRTTFPRRLRDRLRAMQGKAKTLGQWRALERATALAQRTIDRIGEVPDARAG